MLKNIGFHLIPLKNIGFHVSATEDLLIDRLERKIRAQVDDQDFDFPIVDRNLYSAEPWEVLKDNDPNWQITHSENKSSRTMFVFTPLNRLGRKRFLRAAGSGKWDGGTGGIPVKCNNGLVIGTRSYFEFKLPAGNIVPGHWSMHEYRLPREDNWNQAVCKITHEVDKELRISYCINWTKTPLAIRFDDFKNRGFFNKRKQCVIPDKGVDKENVRTKRLKVQQETESSSTLITDEDKDYANELDNLLNESDDGEDNNQPVDEENPGMEAATNQQEVNDMDDHIDWNLIDEEHQLQPFDEPNLSEEDLQLSMSVDDLMNMLGDDEVVG